MRVTNPREYDDKRPTNLRIRPDLKAKMLNEIEESSKKGVKKTMADIANEALEHRYRE